MVQSTAGSVSAVWKTAWSRSFSLHVFSEIWWSPLELFNAFKKINVLLLINYILTFFFIMVATIISSVTWKESNKHARKCTKQNHKASLSFRCIPVPPKTSWKEKDGKSWGGSFLRVFTWQRSWGNRVLLWFPSSFQDLKCFRKKDTLKGRWTSRGCDS